MNKAGHTLLRIALQIVSGTTHRQRLILFGVRRSGNHALTNWLTNAIDEGPSDLAAVGQAPPLSHAFSSPSGKVIHFNELNELSLRATFSLFLSMRKQTRKCTTLIVSFEDIRPSAYPNFRRLAGHEIILQRNALETISSRYHNINRKAHSGIGWSRQSCDDYFLDTLRELHKTDSSPTRSIWNYNQWLSSPEYRSNFLREINLSFDLIPNHSGVGGGSSFHGTSGQIENNLESRLTKVQPAAHWCTFLENLVEQHPDLFSSEDIHVAKTFIQANASD